MGLVRYSIEQLKHLKSSPLVKKPDGLPDISQWMESQQVDQATRKGRAQQGRPEEGEGIEPYGQRPLFQSRQSGRGNGPSAEEIVLGPPKTSFTSSARGQNRFAEGAEKSSTADDSHFTRERRDLSDRFRKDKDTGRTRDKNGQLNSRSIDDDGEGWQSVRTRKSFGAEDGDRWQRTGDRTRDRQTRNNEGEQDPRRNGTGKNRFEKSWLRDDPAASATEPAGRSTDRGGWRDRDKREGKDWARGGRVDPRAEEVPEWLDEPVNESKQAKNVNDFEEWKAQQKAKAAGKSEGDFFSSVKPAPEEAKVISPLASGGKALFGMYGEGKKADNEASNGGGTVKAAGKAKASKFANFFSKEEEPIPLAEPIPATNSLPKGEKTNEADKEGFNRILALLGKSNISSPPPTAGSAPPQQLFSPPADGPRSPGNERGALRSMQSFQEEQHLPHPAPHQQPRFGLNQGPQNPHMQKDRFASPGEEFGPPSPARNENAVSRSGAATAPNNKGGPFDRPNSGEVPKMDANHAFLLNLMQSHATPQQQHGPTSPPPDVNNGFTFPDKKQQQGVQQQRMLHEQQGQMRGMPPGFFDERALYEAEHQRQREMERPQGELGGKMSQRPPGPPGFFDDPAISGFQRGQAENSNRPPPQQTNPGMGIPRQGPLSPEDFIKMGLPPGMQRPPHGQEVVAPPPGFRMPPGFIPPPPAGMPPPSIPHSAGMQPPRSGGGPGMFPPGQNIMPPPPPGGPQGPPHQAGYFHPPGAPPGFGRGPGALSPGQIPPGMGIPPQGQHAPPFDLMAEMQQRSGGRGAMGHYGP